MQKSQKWREREEKKKEKKSRSQIAECADGAWNIIKLSNDDDGNQFEIEAIEWKQSTFSSASLLFFSSPFSLSLTLSFDV